LNMTTYCTEYCEYNDCGHCCAGETCPYAQGYEEEEDW